PASVRQTAASCDCVEFRFLKMLAHVCAVFPPRAKVHFGLPGLFSDRARRSDAFALRTCGDVWKRPAIASILTSRLALLSRLARGIPAACPTEGAVPFQLSARYDSAHDQRNERRRGSLPCHRG